MKGMTPGIDNKKIMSGIYNLTKGTPMRYGKLQQDSGILSNTTVASKMMEGEYVATEGSSKSMVGMLQMIRGVAVGIKDRMVDIVINCQDYTQYCKGCR